MNRIVVPSGEPLEAPLLGDGKNLREDVLAAEVAAFGRVGGVVRIGDFVRVNLLERDVVFFQQSQGWALLGYAYNLQAKPSADAVPTLEKAYEMLPGRGDVAYNLLLGYARASKRQEAIDLVATAEARGVSEEQLAPARQTLLQLDFQYAVALAREKKFDEAVPLLEQVVAESTHDGMKQQAADLLKQIRP